MKNALKLFAVLTVFAGVLLVFPADGFAANGKVAGDILDKRTKEPVMGARVHLLQDGKPTRLGAISDLDGKFMILNVPPGTYDVEISYTGYGKQLIEDIPVQTDLTAELKPVALVEQAVQGDTTIVTTGGRATIRKEVVTSQVKVTAGEIAKLPIRNVNDLLKLQVGVTNKDGFIYVRGGRNDETIYIIDGVEVRNILTGTADRGQVQSGNMSVATAGIQEFTFIKGGFDAQYGNATSGVVNISTKEGTTDRTRFHLEYFTDRFGSPSLNKYSFNSDQVQFTISGPEPLLGWVLPKLLKWNTEGKVAYFASVQMDKTDTHLSYSKLATPLTEKNYPVTRFLGIGIPDRNQNTYNTHLKFTIRPSGLLKFNADWKGEFLRYNYAGRGFQWNFRYSPATAQQVNDQTTTFSLSAEHTISRSSFYRAQVSRYQKRFVERPGDPNDPAHGKNPDLFLFDEEWESFSDANANGRWDEGEYFSDIYREDTTADGKPIYTAPGAIPGFAGDPFEDLNGNGVYDAPERILRDTNGNGRFDFERRQTNNVDRAEPFKDGDLILGEPFIDMDKNGQFNPGVDRFITCNCPENQDLNRNSQWDGPSSPYSGGLPFRDLNGNGVYDTPNATWDPGERFIDQNGNGMYDFGNNGFVDNGTWVQQTFYQSSGTTQTTAKFDFNSQISTHYLSTGLQMDMDKIYMADLRYPHFRYNGIPDGQEFGDRGVFRDFYVRNPILANFYVSDRVEYGQLIASLSLRYDFFFQASGLNEIRTVESLGDKVPDPIKNKLSPRLGFSYPISERAKLFFNYGHYFQLPNLERFYRRATQGTSAFGIVGNFNLDYTKKIKYEFGSEILLSSSYRGVLTGFYNDDFGLLSSLVNRYGGFERDEYSNVDYGRTRGVEAEISRVAGGYFQGYLDYQFSIAQGKSSSEISNYLDRFNGREIPIQEFPLDWDQRHQITFNFNINVPNDDHPRLFGLSLPDNWNMNLIWQYGSGFPYSPGSEFPGLPANRNDFSRRNALRLSPTSQVDVRFQKSFRVWKQDYTFQAWVNNLLDRKNITAVYANTGRTNTSQVRQDQYGYNVVVPTSIARSLFEGDPRNYSTGRNIKMGISVDF